MEHSLSLEAKKPSASLDFLSILCIPKIRYRISESPPTAFILSHIDSVHGLLPNSLEPI